MGRGSRIRAITRPEAISPCSSLLSHRAAADKRGAAVTPPAAWQDCPGVGGAGFVLTSWACLTLNREESGLVRFCVALTLLRDSRTYGPASSRALGHP